MSAPLLTEEQIADMRVSALMSPDAAHTEWVDLLARAVESVSRAPLLAEIGRLTAERDAACKLVADMHSAAMGANIGPALGVVEDVAALKAERDAAMADAERYRWLRSNPQWLGWEHDFRPDEVDREIDAARSAT